jgi:hypothetical protein
VEVGSIPRPPTSQLGDILSEWLARVDGSGCSLKVLDPRSGLGEGRKHALDALAMMRQGMRPPHPRIEHRSPRAFASLREACRSTLIGDEARQGIGAPRLGPLAQLRTIARLPRRSATRGVRGNGLRCASSRPDPGRNPIGRASTRPRAVQHGGSDAAEIYQSGRACGASD